MELLQNRRYKEHPEEIAECYLHEIKTQIESMIELCREGKISVYEAAKIFDAEKEAVHDFILDICKMFDKLDKDIFKLPYFARSSPFYDEEHWDEEEEREFWKKIYNENLVELFKDMERHEDFLGKALEKVIELLDSPDYQKNRKLKIKQQIIRDGLPLPLEKVSNTITLINKNNLADIYMNHLVTLFPEFYTDYLLLEKHGYLEKTEKKLLWKKTKQALAEYFHSIKPEEMETMKWGSIESIFAVTDLKNSLSRNGNEFKGKSKDFLKWLEIKDSSKKSANPTQITKYNSSLYPGK